jgi:hypothetical protein
MNNEVNFGLVLIALIQGQTEFVQAGKEVRYA